MAPKRVHFRENQTLTHSELSDEQAYRIGMRRRHNIAHHRWGIVQGLVLTGSRMGVNLSSGFAVDGYGRELVVPRALELRQQVLEGVLNGGATGYLDAWLTYHIVASDGPQEHCYEDAWLRLDCADSSRVVDPYHHWDIPQSDLDSGADQEPPPDGPEREWPVYLGRIAVGMGDPAMLPYSRNAIELTERAYATLVGASVQTPAGYRWMQLGDDEAADNRRFAISLPDEEGQSQDRLVLERDGNASLWGRVRLSAVPRSGSMAGDGNLALIGTASECSASTGIELTPLGTMPGSARSWQLYRTAVEIEQAQQMLNVKQLRFETFHPGEEGDPARSAWVVGRVAGNAPVNDGSFEPLLTVRSDGTVTVHCDLKVEGQLIEEPIPADVEDGRFRDALLEHWAEGLIAAGVELDTLYELPLDVKVEVGSVSGQEVPYTLTLTHSGGGGDRAVPIFSIISEFWNEDGELINVENPKLMRQPNPLKPGKQMIVTSGPTLEAGATETMTLTVRVFALSAAQNMIEKTASASFELSQL